MNIKDLQKNIGFSEQELSDLLNHFIDDTEKDLLNLYQAIEGDNISLVNHFAHRIKGSAQLLNINDMSSIANFLEKSLSVSNITKSQYETLNGIFSKVKQDVKKLKI